MSNDHPTGVETRDLASGWQGVVHHGDGSTTKVWAPTKAAAERKAEDYLEVEA
jgi:hypothetical protein